MTIKAANTIKFNLILLLLLLAIDIPKLYFIKRIKKSNQAGSNYKIVERFLNDFVGLEKIDH